MCKNRICAYDPWIYINYHRIQAHPSHVGSAYRSIPFNLICNMTTFRKMFFDLLISIQSNFRWNIIYTTQYAASKCFGMPGVSPQPVNSQSSHPVSQHARNEPLNHGQNICHHVAACAIPFDLICNMTIF